jgi:putative FmdB family regulatory protein
LPTYQYACSACQHEFEVFQAFSESSLTHCPECNGELRKVYSAVGVVFKGSGFYKTDSKSDTKTATPVVKESTVKATTTESVAPVKSAE